MPEESEERSADYTLEEGLPILQVEEENTLLNYQVNLANRFVNNASFYCPLRAYRIYGVKNSLTSEWVSKG